MRPHIYFLFFGSARYLRLLNRCVGSFLNTGTSLAWSVLTDERSAALLPANYPTRIVTPDADPRLIRIGNQGEAFDRKSTYLLALMQERQETPFVVLDCDNVFHSDPAPCFDGLLPLRMAMAECPFDPPIRAPFIIERPLPERTSALMYFPADARYWADLYREAWHKSVEPEHYLLEQRTWSLAWHWSNGQPLPRTMSWSRFWGDAPADVIVRHLHGEQKWEELPRA